MDAGHPVQPEPDRYAGTMVSVIIPAFNRVELLGRAVRSVLRQTHSNLELIIVDDGSREDVRGALSEFRDAKLNYHRRESNLGISAARNYGIHLSKGEYIAFLDSDDEWTDRKLTSQLARLRGKGAEYRVCYTRSERFDDTLGRKEAISEYQREGHILNDLLHKTRMATSSLLVEKKLLEEVRGFDEEIRWGEDWDLYIRLADRSPFACVDEPLTIYHLHDHGRASDNIERDCRTVESLNIIGEKNQQIGRASCRERV
jgi:glycosyltransferase involved in cell wall biosynthesis